MYKFCGSFHMDTFFKYFLQPFMVAPCWSNDRMQVFGTSALFFKTRSPINLFVQPTGPSHASPPPTCCRFPRSAESHHWTPNVDSERRAKRPTSAPARSLVSLASHRLTAGVAAVFSATWINSQRLRQSHGRVSKVAVTAGPLVVTAIWATRQHIHDIGEARKSKDSARDGMLLPRQRDSLIGFLQAR